MSSLYLKEHELRSVLVSCCDCETALPMLKIAAIPQQHAKV